MSKCIRNAVVFDESLNRHCVLQRLMTALQPELNLLLDFLVRSSSAMSSSQCPSCLRKGGTMCCASMSSSPVCTAQVFRFSVWRGRPTPGSALMNLRYRDERASAPGTQARGHSPASHPPASHAACSTYLSLQDDPQETFPACL